MPTKMETLCVWRWLTSVVLAMDSHYFLLLWYGSRTCTICASFMNQCFRSWWATSCSSGPAWWQRRHLYSGSSTMALIITKQCGLESRASTGLINHQLISLSILNLASLSMGDAFHNSGLTHAKPGLHP